MIEKKLVEFINRFIRVGKIDKDENLFENGNLNSLFIMQLILFIEKEFSISVRNNVIGTEEFNSISSICNYIEKQINYSEKN